MLNAIQSSCFNNFSVCDLLFMMASGDSNINENNSNNKDPLEELDELKIKCDDMKQQINDLEIEVKEWEQSQSNGIEDMNDNNINEINIVQLPNDEENIDLYYREYLHALLQQCDFNAYGKLTAENANMKKRLSHTQAILKHVLKLLLQCNNCDVYGNKEKHVFLKIIKASKPHAFCPLCDGPCRI
eukprot:105444_1